MGVNHDIHHGGSEIHRPPAAYDLLPVPTALQGPNRSTRSISESFRGDWRHVVHARLP